MVIFRSYVGLWGYLTLWCDFVAAVCKLLGSASSSYKAFLQALKMPWHCHIVDLSEKVTSTRPQHSICLPSGNQTWLAENPRTKMDVFFISENHLFPWSMASSTPCLMKPDSKSHKIPLNHHFPMVFLWFSYGLRMAPAADPSHRASPMECQCSTSARPPTRNGWHCGTRYKTNGGTETK